MSTDGSTLGYAELLRLATAKGLQELDTTIVQIPSDQNHGHAVVTATVRTAAALYRAIGEAWWDGATGGARQQVLVLAEGRAKTRALCEAVGMPQQLMVDGVPERPAAAAGTSVAAPRPNGAARPSESPTQAARIVESAAPTARGSGGSLVVPVAASADAGTRAPSRPTPMAAVPAEREAAPDQDGARDRAADDADDAPALRARAQSPARPTARSVPGAEGLGPDILQKLLQMTRRIGELKQDELTEEEALAKLDSFFQRAFNHPLAEGTRMEGQRVVQRLAADLARLSQERGEGGAYAAS